MASACALAALLTVSGCAQNAGGGSSKGAAAKEAPVVVERVDEIAAGLPERYRESGTLVVGVNVPYPPNEFNDEQGGLVGFDVDLLQAVATTLGLQPEYKEVDFAKIIPSVADGTFDVGMSSVTDTREREKFVDFVTYFNAGSQWAQRPGSDIDPKNACGKTVAVNSDTLQATVELPAKRKACADAGKRAIDIVEFLDRVEFLDKDAGFAAVVTGKVDAMTADSPVTAYAIKQSDGKLEAAGPIFDSAPYGWPVKKDSLLGRALLAALQSVIKSGAYKQIATKWGLASGMIDKPVINGAVS